MRSGIQFAGEDATNVEERAVRAAENAPAPPCTCAVLQHPSARTTHAIHRIIRLLPRMSIEFQCPARGEQRFGSTRGAGHHELAPPLGEAVDTRWP